MMMLSDVFLHICVFLPPTVSHGLAAVVGQRTFVYCNNHTDEQTRVTGKTKRLSELLMHSTIPMYYVKSISHSLLLDYSESFI